MTGVGQQIVRRPEDRQAGDHCRDTGMAVVEKAEFTDVELKNEKFEPAKKPVVESTLEVVNPIHA